MLTITLLFCRCLHISTLSDNLDLLAHISTFQSGFLNMPCSEVEHSDRVMGAEQCSINYVGSKLSNRQVRENIIARVYDRERVSNVGIYCTSDVCGE